ncbi:MAG: hypothetical protein RLZZ272_302 [Actinomycetota bacterium]
MIAGRRGGLRVVLAAGVVAAGLVAAPVPARATAGPVEVSGVTYILS